MIAERIIKNKKQKKKIVSSYSAVCLFVFCKYLKVILHLYLNIKIQFVLT